MDLPNLPLLNGQALHSLSVSSPQQFEGPIPAFPRPQEIGSFSLGRKTHMEREYRDNDDALLKLRRRGTGLIVANLQLNLDHGMETYIDRGQKQKDAEHLDPILRWILKHKHLFLSLRHKIGIICWRGRLHEIMVSPYSDLNPWTFVVCMIDGIRYMSYVPTDEAEEVLDENQQKRMYWGFKFERIMTTDPDNAAALAAPVNNFESFQSVLFATLGGKGILFAAEMDCWDPDEDATNRDRPNCYVELKTCRAIYTQKEMHDFCRHKLLRYWSQSFVCGVPKILVGFRDDKGQVISTDELPMEHIPAIAQRNGNSWSPSVCVNFLHQFLQFVEEVVVEDHEKAIFKFKWSPKARKIVATKETPSRASRFIPDWYLEERPGYAN